MSSPSPWSRRRARTPRPCGQLRFRPELELLEGRVLLSDFTVVNTADAGPGSLRQALLDANATTGADRILFAIPGAGPHTIRPASALPTITEAVTLDGTTQPGFAGTPVIELDGSNAGPGASGLRITGSGSTVRGLVINRFDDSGVEVTGSGASGNVLSGNFIGTDVSGSRDFGNRSTGVRIGPGATSNTLGGTTAPARNLISGNFIGVEIEGTGVRGNVVAGNYIGTDVSGTRRLGNGIGVSIVSGATSNTVGGTTAAARNLISANGSGVEIIDEGTSGNVVAGNYIGTDVTGTADLGNTGIGVLIRTFATSNTVGGTTAGAGNLISGNSFTGVHITGFANDNVVAGNLIGTDVSGSAPLGNGGDGVLIFLFATSNTVGGTTAAARNTIAFNAGNGITIGDTGIGLDTDNSTGNVLLGNSLFGNGGLGIDLANDGVTPNDNRDPDAGPNRLQNYPALTRVESVPADTIIAGTLNSTPGRTFRLEFFSSPAAEPSGFGEGRSFLGSLDVTTDAAGNAAFSFTAAAALPDGSAVTATATDLTTRDTSEFSRAVLVGVDNVPVPPGGAVPGDLNTLFVQALYRDVLGREADPRGLSIWVGLLPDPATANPARYAVARQLVAQGIWNSGEHRGQQINSYYLDLLGRLPDPVGAAYWFSALYFGGLSEQEVVAGIAGSAEYRGRFASDEAFVAGLYADLLGVPDGPVPLSYNAGAFDPLTGFLAGQRGPADLARDVVFSDQYLLREINGWSLDFLGRPADEDPGRLGVSFRMYRIVADPLLAVTTLLASDEFLARARQGLD